MVALGRGLIPTQEGKAGSAQWLQEWCRALVMTSRPLQLATGMVPGFGDDIAPVVAGTTSVDRDMPWLQGSMGSMGSWVQWAAGCCYVYGVQSWGFVRPL